MAGNLSYVKFDKTSTKKCELIKKVFEMSINVVDKNINNSREKSLAITKLEESFMWVGKAVRDEQIIRNGKQEHLPERSNI